MNKKVKVYAGKKIHKGEYLRVPVEDTVGKTVEAVGLTTVDGAFGDEPCTVLFFSDGTMHGFVHPADDD